MIFKRCCISGCDKTITWGYNLFCSEHYKQYYLPYKGRTRPAWLTFLISSEQKERYHQRKTIKDISLEDLIIDE